MSAAKLTLGYATRTEAVLAMRGRGMSTLQIAERIGIEPKTVSALEASAKRSRARMLQPVEQQGRAILLRPDVLSRLRRPAERRGIHPNALAQRIVEAVVSSNLIDAVLDDEAAIDG